MKQDRVVLSVLACYLACIYYAKRRRRSYMQQKVDEALEARHSRCTASGDAPKGSVWRVHNLITALDLEFESWWSMSSRGLFLTYAIPTISSVLYKTGGFERETARRYADMELLIREFNENAVDGTEVINDDMVVNFAGQPERAKRALQRVNAIHQQYKSMITYNDMVYTWSVFACTPARWMESRWSVRPLSAGEKECIYFHWLDIGRLLNLQVDKQFRNWDEIMAFKTAYETKHMRPTKSNAVVASSTIDYFIDGFFQYQWMRALSRPLVFQVMSCLQENSAHAEALGLPPANPVLYAVIDAFLTMRALVWRFLFPPPLAFTQDRLTAKEATSFSVGKGCPMTKNLYYPARALDFNNTTYKPLACPVVKRQQLGATPLDQAPDGGYALEDMGPPSVRKGWLCEKPVYLGHPPESE